jgi:hypothetical protein
MQMIFGKNTAETFTFFEGLRYAMTASRMTLRDDTS